VTVTVAVTISRETDMYVNRRLNVTHFDVHGTLNWIDPAGYLVARSPKPMEWPPILDPYDFQLDVATALVTGILYLPHA
jgi:hypothetical protein